MKSYLNIKMSEQRFVVLVFKVVKVFLLLIFPLSTVFSQTEADTLLLTELTVSSNKTTPIQKLLQMSVINLPVTHIKSLPAFFGETDILKSLQLLPGVQSGGEGRSGMYVRGGGADQNLFMVDGVPVYSVSHLFGFFSVFNADAINNVEIIKGGFPARYGGRVSSVVDITLKDGNMQQFQGEGAIGIISSKLTLEGPLLKDRSSFIISGRRTFADLFLQPVLAITNPNYKLGYYFYDMTAKVNYRFSANDRIFLSTYMGDDVYYQSEKNNYNDNYGKRDYQYRSDLKWGNITTAFRWNHIYSPKLFSNLSLNYSRYRNMSAVSSLAELTMVDLDVDPPVTKFERRYHASEYISEVNDWGCRIAFDYSPSAAHHIRFGGNTTYHVYTPGASSIKTDTIPLLSETTKIYGMEYSAFLEDEISFSDRLMMNIGVHWSAFDVEDKFYRSLQPRVSARYMITDDLSAKATYSRMAQYMHLLSNSNIGLQLDLWVPSTSILRPQISDQITVGLAHTFRNDYELSFEGYYKTMNNVIEYREGITFLDPNETWQEKVVQGNGRSYGVEFFAQKKTGSFTGWIGYTLSWTDRLFDELNDGERFYYKYDRRHDISLVTIKQLNPNLEVSATWVFGSGQRMTVPVSIYRMVNPMETIFSYYTHTFVQDQTYIEYNTRNGYQLNAYHRLDLSVSLIKNKKWGERRWIFSLYNAYCRINPFYVDIKAEYGKDYYDPINGMMNRDIKYKFVQYSLFPIVPSISYQFKF